jgi:hypothetical protein
MERPRRTGGGFRDNGTKPPHFPITALSATSADGVVGLERPFIILINHAVPNVEPVTDD